MAECCSCNSSKIKLIFSCSGAANTGYLADNVARQLMKDNHGKMTCLAAIGADLPGFIESSKGSDKNIVIDGCPIACGKVIFENKGIPYEHFVLTDFGVEKGKTEITPEVIAEVSQKLVSHI